MRFARNVVVLPDLMVPYATASWDALRSMVIEL